MAETEQLVPPPHPEKVEESVEKEVIVEEQEKAATVTEESKVEEGAAAAKAEEEGVAASEPLTETPSTEGTPSFKEESYKVGDLKEWEKKALEAFRLKVEEAIKGKTIYKKEKAVAVAAPAPAAEEAGLETKEEAAEEGKEEEKAETGGKLEEKVEEEAVVGTEEKKDEEEVPIEEKETEVVIKDRELEVEGVVSAPTEEAVAPVPALEGPKEFYLWDVPIHAAAADERTDVVLLKFLRARDFKVEAAFGMLKSAVAWRRDLGVDVTKAAEEATPVAVEGAALSAEEEVEFASLAYLHGSGREGHPVCYNEYGALQSKAFYGDAAKVGRFLRWRIGMLERTIASSLDFTPGGIHSMVQVIDLKHSPVFSRGRHATNKALTLFQANYPELVHKQIILNIPWYSAFLSWYAAFGRQLTPRMQRKVVLVRPGKTAETLFKYISPDQVPVKYGGLSRQGDAEFEGVEAPVTEGVIKPGAKQTIELSVEAGWTSVWDVGVVGWDVVYGEEFSPSDEKSYAVIISKAKKVSPGSEPIRNSFKAAETGKIIITIDNSSSKKKKILVYRSTAKKKTIPVA